MRTQNIASIIGLMAVSLVFSACSSSSKPKRAARPKPATVAAPAQTQRSQQNTRQMVDSGPTGDAMTDAVRDVIFAHRGDIQKCYELGLKDNPNIGGQVMIQFNVDREGLPQDVKVESSQLNHDMTERCIVGVIRGLKFKELDSDGSMEVHYPFVFSTQPAR